MNALETYLAASSEHKCDSVQRIVYWKSFKIKKWPHQHATLQDSKFSQPLCGKLPPYYGWDEQTDHIKPKCADCLRVNAMNLLQNAGIISDNAVLPSDVADADCVRAVKWLAQDRGLF